MSLATIRNNFLKFSNSNKINNQRLEAIIGTSLAVIILSVSIKPVQRIVLAIIGSIQLRYILFTSKDLVSLSASGTNRSPTEQDIKTDKDNNSIVVSGLYYHPVKSLKAVPLQSATFDSRGLTNDRKYMLITPLPKPVWGSFGPKDVTHRFVSQRQCPILTQVTVIDNVEEQTLTFTCPVLDKSNQTITISTSDDVVRRRRQYLASVWSDTVSVQDLGDAAATYFNSILRLDDEIPDEYKQAGVRLVVQRATDTRTVPDNYIPMSARSILSSIWSTVSSSSLTISHKVSLSDGFPM
jgi:MOSC N-terminal beta barrel domain